MLNKKDVYYVDVTDEEIAEADAYNDEMNSRKNNSSTHIYDKDGKQNSTGYISHLAVEKYLKRMYPFYEKTTTRLIKHKIGEGDKYDIKFVKKYLIDVKGSAYKIRYPFEDNICYVVKKEYQKILTKPINHFVFCRFERDNKRVAILGFISVDEFDDIKKNTDNHKFLGRFKYGNPYVDVCDLTPINQMI